MDPTIVLQSIVNGLLIGGIYALISMGLTLIYGIMGIVNFAHGEYLMLGMYSTYWLFAIFGLDPYISIALVTPLLFVIGAATQKFLIKPVLEASHFNQILLTIGLSTLLLNGALLAWTSDYRTVITAYATRAIEIFNVRIGIAHLSAFITAMLTAFAFYIFMSRTDTGKMLRAAAQNRDAASLMGVNVHKMYTIAFGISASFTGVAGAILMPIYYAFPAVGLDFVLTSFVVVVLGGLKSFRGALVGGLIIGLAESLGGTFVATEYNKLITFIIFATILLIRPQGLFKKM